MIIALQTAAAMARRASTIRTQRRTVEVVITEEGLVVRGTYRDARHAFSASSEVAWSALANSPRQATNAVALVIRSLEERGEDAGIDPVREGE